MLFAALSIILSCPTVKHAFPKDFHGQLNIRLRNEELGNISLTIEDTGVGIEGDFDVETSSSLGLQLVQALVDQLDGTLDVHYRDPTRFQIDFPETIDH